MKLVDIKKSPELPIIKMINYSIELCYQCSITCQDLLYNYCLKVGGKHSEPKHIRLMIDCIQSCQQVAELMSQGSPLSYNMCENCADICEKCAKACELLNDERMIDFIRLCRATAKQCREMSFAGADLPKLN